MSCSAYISYQIEGEEGSLPGVSIKSEEPPANKKRKPAAKHTSTSFVLVDPSDDKSKGGGKDARSSIRKHASKACAAQRLATIAEKKKSLNQLTKRERKAKHAAEKLEAALEELGLVDYSIGPATLDQVFLDVVMAHGVQEENTREERHRWRLPWSKSSG